MPPDVAPAQAETDALLARARTAADVCGVTRLAELTRLDRVGAPVFHAVRPASRALCVHQGKGLTRWEAQIGALMEAVESANAEAFEAREIVAPLQALDVGERPAELGDFCRDRQDPVRADEPLVWTAAERLIDGARVLVPFDCVSLDFTRARDRRLDPSSNGLAARFDMEAAALNALLEVLERDATAAWRATSPAQRAIETIALETVPYGWFGELHDRIRGAGMRLTAHAMPALLNLPAIQATVFSRSAPGPNARASGWVCADTGEAALRGAVLEALQSRLTGIAGARDDILHGRPPAAAFADTPPLPPDIAPRDWRRLTDSWIEPGAVTARDLAERLAAAGYPDASVVRVSPQASDVAVAKAFAPGLAFGRRARRPPLPRRMT